jgi:phosphate transport system protein
MNEHILKRFDERLDKLIGRLEKMGAMAREQVGTALLALAESNSALAAQVIARDAKLDKLDIKIDKLGMAIVAAHQPVAMDLRLIMAGLSMNRMIERIGDCAVNIAERVALLADDAQTVRRTRILEMGAVAERMIEDALHAFLHLDVERARAVCLTDDTVDALDSENFQALIALMRSEPSRIEACSHLLLVNRNLERIADLSTGIAEEVFFLTSATIVRHRKWTDPATETPTESAEPEEPGGQ